MYDVEDLSTDGLSVVLSVGGAVAVQKRTIFGLDFFVNPEFKIGKKDIFSIFLLIMFKNVKFQRSRLKYRCRL